MRKFFIYVLICLMLVSVSGCKKKENDRDIKLEKYQYIYQTITDNDNYVSQSQNFDMDITMSKLSDGTYRYDITIDRPKIAMYEIQVMAVENNIEYALNNRMMPTLGIIDDQVYNMVPNQVDTERGYVKGLILSGITSSPIVNLKVRISYKDYLLVNETSEYFNQTIDYDSQFATGLSEGEVTENSGEVAE